MKTIRLQNKFLVLFLSFWIAGACSLSAFAEKNAKPLKYTKEDLQILSAIIYAEAGNEPTKGQLAVAQVVVNRMLSKKYPNTIKAVVKQKGQFSVVKNGKIPTKTSEKSTANAVAVLKGQRVFSNNVFYFSGKAQRGKKVWGRIGNHVFCYG